MFYKSILILSVFFITDCENKATLQGSKKEKEQTHPLITEVVSLPVSNSNLEAIGYNVHDLEDEGVLSIDKSGNDYFVLDPVHDNVKKISGERVSVSKVLNDGMLNRLIIVEEVLYVFSFTENIYVFDLSLNLVKVIESKTGLKKPLKILKDGVQFYNYTFGRTKQSSNKYKVTRYEVGIEKCLVNLKDTTLTTEQILTDNLSSVPYKVEQIGSETKIIAENQVFSLPSSIYSQEKYDVENLLFKDKQLYVFNYIGKRFKIFSVRPSKTE